MQEGQHRMRFTQKAAVLTGDDSGIGRATANRLLGEGATVVADIEHTQAWPELHEKQVHRLILDVADPEASHLPEAHLREQHGGKCHLHRRQGRA
jgi:NAD(P)-dependent dehydrogenase (short-subunit alcohol dehydrogenase family)